MRNLDPARLPLGTRRRLYEIGLVAIVIVAGHDLIAEHDVPLLLIGLGAVLGVARRNVSKARP